MGTNKNTTAPTEDIKDNAVVQTDVPEPVTAEPAVNEPKKVEIFIPRGQANDETNLLVSINGVNYLLPKGKKSEVPDFVAAEIRRSWEAQEALDARIDELTEAAKQ